MDWDRIRTKSIDHDDFVFFFLGKILPFHGQAGIPQDKINLCAFCAGIFNEGEVFVVIKSNAFNHGIDVVESYMLAFICIGRHGACTQTNECAIRVFIIFVRHIVRSHHMANGASFMVIS